MLYTTICMRNQFLFCKKNSFQNTNFSRLNCQLKRKKHWQSKFVKIFQVSADKEMDKVNLSSFRLKSLFKFVLAWLARKEQDTLTSQLCLHTPMQTLLSANQNACTNLVIL